MAISVSAMQVAAYCCTGIGAAIAQALVAVGAFVIVSDIDEPAGCATADRLGAAWLKLDVREELAWIGAMARVLDSQGRLDVLVNNTGFSGLEDAAASGARRAPRHGRRQHHQHRFAQRPGRRAGRRRLVGQQGRRCQFSLHACCALAETYVQSIV